MSALPAPSLHVRRLWKALGPWWGDLGPIRVRDLCLKRQQQLASRVAAPALNSSVSRGGWACKPRLRLLVLARKTREPLCVFCSGRSRNTRPALWKTGCFADSAARESHALLVQQ